MFSQIILGFLFILIGIGIYFYVINKKIEEGNSDWIGYIFGIGFFLLGLFLIFQGILNFSIFELLF